MDDVVDPNLGDRATASVSANLTQGERAGTLITRNGSVTLDYVVVARDNFDWKRPSNSPFDWSVSTRGNGTLRPEPVRERVILDAPHTGDYVGITSPYLVDFDAYPAWELDIVARSTARSNDNVQELFFLNGADSDENYFLMYDMGGASPNPDTSDDRCGESRDIPFNRDQLSYRDFDRNRQCWDGFADRPIDWSSKWHGELRANLSSGYVSAFFNDRFQADLARDDGQVLPPADDYRA